MKKGFIKLLSVAVFLSMFAAYSSAQNDDRAKPSAVESLYLISAKAGGVNLIEGNVFVEREGNFSSRLIKGDTVKVGETVKTEGNAKAEILLNPGSYARLAANSEFEFKSTSLDDLKLHMNRGTAIFEVYATDDFKVTLTTPKSRFYLIESGVYRLDVSPDGGTRLQVWKGKAQVGDFETTKVKKSREIFVNGTAQADVEKFDRDEKDSFDEWSEDRAKDLAQANARLERKTLRDSLMSSFGNNRWSGFDTYGLWAYDSRFGGYCFLPFSYGWRSPYGFWFERNFFSSRPSSTFYNTVYNQTQTNINMGSGNNGSNNGSGAGNPGSSNFGNPPRNPGVTNPGIVNTGVPSSPRRVDPGSINAPSEPGVRVIDRVRTPVVDN